MRTVAPVSPGEMLDEEFLKPLGLTKYRLAKDIGVPAQRIGDIVAGKRAITADTDLRLCRYFGLSDGWWLRGQANYDTAPWHANQWVKRWHAFPGASCWPAERGDSRQSAAGRTWSPQPTSSSRCRFSVIQRSPNAAASRSTRYTERCWPPVQPIATVT